MISVVFAYLPHSASDN